MKAYELLKDGIDRVFQMATNGYFSGQDRDRVQKAATIDEIIITLRVAKQEIKPALGRWLVTDHITPIEIAARRRAAELLVYDWDQEQESDMAYMRAYKAAKTAYMQLLKSYKLIAVAPAAGGILAPLLPVMIGKASKDIRNALIVYEDLQTGWKNPGQAWPESLYEIAPTLKNPGSLNKVFDRQQGGCPGKQPLANIMGDLRLGMSCLEKNALDFYLQQPGNPVAKDIRELFRLPAKKPAPAGQIPQVS